MQQGRVYYSSAPASVTLSAYIADTAGGLPVSVRKDFYIAIPAAQSAEERVQADAVLLEQPSVDGNVVTLPDTAASGSSISWYTSDARVVTATGTVTPAAQTEYVLLTACLTNDGEKAYRYFEICVPGTAEQALQRASVYDAAAPLVQSGWNMADSDYAYAALCADGMRMTQTASQYLNDAGAGNGAQTPPLGYVFGESAVERDAQNRTAVYTAQYSGIYEVDVAFSINGDFLTSYNGVELADTFYTMGVAAIADASNPAVRYTAGVLRLYPSVAIILNTSSSNTSSMSVKRAGLPGNFIASNAKIKVDTVAGTLAVTVNGDESKTSTGSLMSNAGYINGVFAYGMERFNAGSYLNIHSVTLRQLAHQYPAAVQTVLDQLPASLQTGSVTGDLDLPQISGVTWTTSNSAVIAADGSVTRPARDTDVTVSAVIAAGGYAYRKEYVVTVAAAEATNNNTFRPTDDETYWYEQPRNADGSWDPYGYPMYGDPMHITDAEFFGVWDAVMQSWTTAPYFRYSDFPGMADVEAAAKAGNYETAKSELLEYYRSLQTSRAASSVSKPTDKDALYYELMARNVYAVGLISGDAVNIFEAGETWDTVSVDVTTALAEAAGSYTQFSNMIMSIDKYYTQAEIYSRESSYAPVLKAEVNGVLKTFPCVKDATVCAGSYGNTNYGNQTVLYVEEGGTYQSYTDRDRRAFLAFDISSLKSSDTIENARIELRIRQTGTGTKELLCYWYKDASWLENTVTWNSFSDMLAFSCNDVECWDYVTSSKTNVKGKICGYHRLNEPTKVSKLYVYYKDDSSVDAEAYAYTYIRQQMGLINSIGCDPSVMNSLDMSNHVTNGTTALYQLIDSVYMTPERFTAFLKHYAAMTDYQVRNNFGRQDNNWGTYATASAYNMSARFPELTQHDYWMEKTRDENDRLFQGLTFEDGMCMELSQNYIVTLLGTFNTPMATYKLTGEPLPFSDQMLDDIYDLVLSLLYCSGPYGGGFNMGDGYDPYTSYQNTFVTWYRNLFSDDPYIAYAASGGGLGCLPSNPTTHYPAGLRTYMRSDWTQNALALSITNKMANASHGHKDALSIAMFAYGKYLLVDPGYGGIFNRNHAPVHDFAGAAQCGNSKRL